MVWKVSEWSGKFSYDLERFQMTRKDSIWSGFLSFLDSLKSFQTVGQFKKSPDNIQKKLTIWNVFRQFAKFQDSLESFRTIWKVSK